MQKDDSMPRSKLEIYVDILGALVRYGPLKFTNIRQKANYHANELKQYLRFLEENGFISKRTLTRDGLSIQ
jgi:predicted transcriptional regulator